MLRLHTFGGLFVENDGVRVGGSVAQRKRLALLSILAVERRSGITRDKLAAILWPELDVARSRNALYQAVAGIRRDLGSDVVIGGPTGELRLNCDLMTSDFAGFNDSLAGGDQEAAIDAYAGPFLDGIFVREAAEFERWVEEVRSACARRYREALRELATRATAAGDHASATRSLRRLADSDPLSAAVALQLMQALMASGEREAAIRHGRIYTDLVRAEFDGEPDARLAAYLGELSRQGALKAERLSTPLDAASGTDVSAAPLNPVDPTSIPAERWSYSPRRMSRQVIVASAVVVAFLGIVAIARQWRTPDSPLAGLDPHRVVVADFENRTGDSTFDLLGAALADWVTQGVMQTGVARVIDPASRFAVRQRTPEMMALTGKERAVAMARAAAAGTVISGAIYRQGIALTIKAQITDLVNDRVLASLEPVSATTSDALQNADVLRDRIAGALASAFDTRISSITLPSSRPPTWAAYQEFVLGLEMFQRDGDLSIPHFVRAAQLDTSFSLPLIWATFAHMNAGRQKQSDSVIALLALRRPPAGSLEELQLQYFQAGSEEEEFMLAERGASRSPGSTWSNNFAVALHDRNRMHEAIRHFEEIDPEHGWARTWKVYWLYYTRALHAAEMYQKELLAARRMLAMEPDSWPMRGVEIRALLALGMGDEARRRREDFLLLVRDARCLLASDVLQQVSLELRAHGDRMGADSLVKIWIRACQHETESPFPEETADERIGNRVSLGFALYRDAQFTAAERVLEGLRFDSVVDPDTRVWATELRGRLAARRGDRQAAERAMRALPVAFSEGGASIGYAAIAALLGERDRAVRRLAEASSNLFYAYLHRDPDFDSLRSYPPFVAIATPK